MEARLPKRCMIQAVVMRVRNVLRDEGDGDGQPGGADKREVGDNAHAGGDKEKSEPAEEAVGGVLECGRWLTTAEDVKGGQEDHADDGAWDLGVGGGAQGFAG